MNTCSTVKHANFLWRRHGSLFKMKDVKKAKRESLVGVLFTTFFYQTFKTQTKLAWLAKIIFLNIHKKKTPTLACQLISHTIKQTLPGYGPFSPYMQCRIAAGGFGAGALGSLSDGGHREERESRKGP